MATTDNAPTIEAAAESQPVTIPKRPEPTLTAWQMAHEWRSIQRNLQEALRKVATLTERASAVKPRYPQTELFLLEQKLWCLAERVRILNEAGFIKALGGD